MLEVVTFWKIRTGIFLFYLTSLAIVTSLATDICPKACLCRGDILTCSPDTNDGVKLQRVPVDLLHYNLLHVRKVNLSHNDVQQVEPADFFGLSQAQHLDLEHNQLRALIRNGFNGLDSAITIKLSHNLIRYIDRFAFDGLHNIRKIDLSHNEIAFIEEEPFQTVHGLGNLHLLDLSFNQIQKVDDVIFLGLESLQELYLSHNLISKVGISAFTPLQNLTMLYLAGNPIKCSCGWLEVLDILQSRDIKIMDTSDALNCTYTDEINCRSLSLRRNVSQDSQEIRSSKMQPDHEGVATNLTADDLRPPDTDEHGNIMSGADSFPLQSPEGERVLSEYDVAMRRRIEAIDDGGRRRMYALVFQERMREFITAIQRGQGSLSTVRATTIPGNEQEKDYEGSVFNGYEKDMRNVTPTTTESEKHGPLKVMATQLEHILEQLFPTSLFNFSEVARLKLGKPKSPERSRLINRIVTGNVNPLGIENVLAMKTMANVSEWSVGTTAKGTTEDTKLTLNTTRITRDALTQSAIIPVISVIGIFAFVCIAAIAFALFSGHCYGANERSWCCFDSSQCCQCKWVATIKEKLMVRKLHMERQSRKTTAAKSEFLKLHCQARNSITSRLSSNTSPLAESSLQQPGMGDRGVVSVTPLVLTDHFPTSSKTTLGQGIGNKANYESYSSSSSPDMYKDITNCLSPATDEKETVGDFLRRNHSPQDEITLFEVPLTRSTSDAFNKRSEDPGLSVQSCDKREQQVRDSVIPPGSTDEVCQSKEQTPTLQSVRPSDAGLEKSSSELRWYARECLSNQRMMVQGRTLSMTSSDDIIGDADIKKGENGN